MSAAILQELFHGKGAHVDPIVCLEDVSAELAGRKITGYPHSIWQIVEHMNYWMDYELYRITGQPKAYPEHAIESWPEPSGTIGEKEWNATRSQFSALLGKMEGLSNSDSQGLQRQVAPDRPASEGATGETVLWQMVAHNSYHIGQVAMIRRCLGAWPPLGGGDSW